MEKLDIDEVKDFVNENISTFHENKLRSLQSVNLRKVLRHKNPYLYRAKNITVACELVTSLLEAFLISSEEKIFGDFLEDLAIFISSRTCNGRKSAATGIDFEFTDANTHYLVSVKSGPNWGNNAQHRRQEQDFQTAVRVLKQSKHALNVQAVLGICYGKVRTRYLHGYLKVVGQNFWYLISASESLYTDIIEPLAHRAKEQNETFNVEKGKIINVFTREFLHEFCEGGQINWKKLVEFNSGNLDLKRSEES